jgi:hypothetical protein
MLACNILPLRIEALDKRLHMSFARGCILALSLGTSSSQSREDTGLAPHGQEYQPNYDEQARHECCHGCCIPQECTADLANSS